MKFSTIIASALLPIATLGSPLQAIRDAEAESAGIFKRATCDIVHVATTVDCWWYPTHGHQSDGNYIAHSFSGTTNNIKFTCYARCENVQGITYGSTFYVEDRHS
jgi:hypothetical protein